MTIKSITAFVKRNSVIFSFFIVSLIIILSYLLTMDCPELFIGAEKWFNLMFQLSVGYIINFMFYVTQVYIPNNKRDSIVRQNISIRINQIVGNMRHSITSLAEIYLKEHTGTKFTDDELSKLLVLRFSDNTKVLDASRTTKDHFVYFTVREWLKDCILKTELEIDRLYKYYGTNISVELIKILEEILHSSYHTTMKILLSVPNDVSFNECNDNFFSTYYHLICELEKINEKEYKN